MGLKKTHRIGNRRGLKRGGSGTRNARGNCRGKKTFRWKMEKS